jgi:response regulator RpfG family c-di-GMP phosphodiesterase
MQAAITSDATSRPQAAGRSLPRILCVDDESHVLEALRDSLRRSFDVRVAEGGKQALALLKADRHAYAVVISDMRMPGMSGDEFLSEAKRVAPRAVRMLLTGHSDAGSAARAVNEGQIFRYLTKPCAPDDLERACAAAVWQHNVLAAERALLEKTLRGSIQALTDVLALASPAAFGRGGRVKRLIAELAEVTGWDDAWEVEVAAMLAHVGAVTLPEATAEKLNGGAPLSPDEQQMVDRVPAVTERILANIPRLEGVQQILAGYGRRYDSSLSGHVLPIGARMLRIALDFDDLQSRGLTVSAALDALAGLEGVYDPELLGAFARVVSASGRTRPIIELAVRDLRAGMMLVEDARARSGQLLSSRGHVVTEELLERLRNFPPDYVHEPIRVFQ